MGLIPEKDYVINKQCKMQKQKLLIKDNIMQNQYHVNNDISEYDTKSTFNYRKNVYNGKT